RYARRRDEDAFESLVSRHLNPVYSVALRRLGGDISLAVEVTQSVFADLARKALDTPMDMNRFKPLAGWLHRHACFLSAKAVRSEVRRKARETLAAALPPADPEEIWTAMAPWVDEAVEKLPEGNREALILRFYEQRDFRSIGVELGITDDTAQKRVSRALDRLRELLEARGVTSTASAIGLALGGHAVAAAPAGIGALVASAARAALVSSVPASPFAWLLAKSAKAPLAGAALLLATGGAWIWNQGRGIGRLQAELIRVTAERDQALADSASSATASAAAAEAQQAERAELLRLRGVVAGMRRAVAADSAPVQGTAPALSLDRKPDASDDGVVVTRAYVDLKNPRPSEAVQLPAKRIDVSKAPADLKDAGTQSTVAAVETVLWATSNDAAAFSGLVNDRSSMLGPGGKFGETERIRASLLKNLTNCTQVHFLLRISETEPIPGETISLALIQPDRDQSVKVSLTFIPVGDRWALEQMTVGDGR
ncbi:MAG: sigma-70 family RNA polymerase sigma factor, partial [Verrucomicrobiae bacterium]|nr:sigma-70 family RNA polymerase sigma factor [Verrucomicrobiae bacterium]